MKPKIIIIIAITIQCLLACSQKPAKQGGEAIERKPYELVRAKEFNKLMHDEPGIILDVRTASEQKKGIIKNAQCLDIFNDSFESELSRLDKSKTYYVYCATGGRSAEASEIMLKKGFPRVVDLDGGYTKWKGEGFPVEE